jgi:hypothetical protein
VLFAISRFAVERGDCTSPNNSSSNFNLVADQISKANLHYEKLLMNKEMNTLLPEKPIPKVIAKQSILAINISIMN